MGGFTCQHFVNLAAGSYWIILDNKNQNARSNWGYLEKIITTYGASTCAALDGGEKCREIVGDQESDPSRCLRKIYYADGKCKRTDERRTMINNKNLIKAKRVGVCQSYR